jgi:hypothetical protein
MNGRMVKMLRKQARKEVKKTEEEMVPKFKAFVNDDLNLWERIYLAWKIIWKRF